MNYSKRNLAGISGIDTRKLTRIIRNKGVVKGKIVNLETETESVINDLKSKIFLPIK
jgi:carbamoyl-phosphate synthase small subunit